MEQGSQEWLDARCGKITASQLSNIMMAKTTAGYQNYMSKLICERLTGEVEETFKSAAMEHGNETEPQARAFYEMETGHDVQEVGFIEHPVLVGSGASPDGLIGLDGGLEIKCPQKTKHMKNLLGGTLDKAYMLQIQWNMEVTEREWWDFVSFNPSFPDHLQMHIRKIERDAEMIEEIKSAVTSFEIALKHQMDALDNLAA